MKKWRIAMFISLGLISNTFGLMTKETMPNVAAISGWIISPIFFICALIVAIRMLNRN